MPRFRVTVLGHSGDSRKIDLAADSGEDLLARLKSRSLAALAIEELPAQDRGSWLALGWMTAEEVAEMLRELGSLLEAGLSVLVALDVLGEQGFSRTGRAVAQALRASVAAGAPLVDAMGAFRWFDPAVLSAVAAGERSGTLPAVLIRLASDRLVMLDRQRKLLTALIQPAITLAMAGAAVWVVGYVVIPTLSGLYEQIGLELPAITRQVLDVFAWLRAWGLYAAAGAVTLALAMRLGCRWTRFRRVVHWGVLRLPVMGKLALWSSLSDAFRLLAMLYRAGIPLLESLRHAALAARNQGVRDQFDALRERVEGGRTLARSASDPPLFNRFCRAMIDTGEQTGALDTQLDRVSTKYDHALDHLYARIEAVFTPAITIALIAIVGYVLVALYMPFVALIEKLSQPR